MTTENKTNKGLTKREKKETAVPEVQVQETVGLVEVDDVILQKAKVIVETVNTIIATKGIHSARAKVNLENKSAKMIDTYPVFAETTEKACARINALGALIAELKMIKAGLAKADAVPTITNIYVIDLISNMVQNGSYKYWLLNGGVNSSNEEINEKELAMWSEFHNMHKELVDVVNIRNISTLNIPVNNRYPVTAEKRILNQYVSKCWEKVLAKVKADDIEEDSKDAFAQ